MNPRVAYVTAQMTRISPYTEVYAFILDTDQTLFGGHISLST